MMPPMAAAIGLKRRSGEYKMTTLKALALATSLMLVALALNAPSHSPLLALAN